MNSYQRHHWNDKFKRYFTSFKRQLADYLNQEFSGFSSTQNKIFLAAIYLIFSSVCTYLIIKAII